MNILMLASDFYPVWGGAGAYVNEIAKNMPKKHTLHVLTPNRKTFRNQLVCNESENRLFPENVHIHYVGTSTDTFVYNLKFQINCRKYVPLLIDNYDIDIIHSQSSLPDIFISLKKLNVPIITTVHSTIEGQIEALKSNKNNFSQLEFSEKMQLLSGPVLNFLEKRYYKGPRRFIAVSNWSKDQLIKKGVEGEKIKVIHNGIDLSRFESPKKIPDFVGLSNIEEPILLFLSRMIRSKGINYLIQSTTKILKKADIHFLFAGHGIKPNLDIPQDKYTILGHVPYDYTPFLHNISDIFILPSLYENFPMSILEAMASNSGVIATNVGGIPEIVHNGNNGILIPTKDVKSIERSVLELVCNNKTSNIMKKNALNTVKSEYNLTNTIKNTISYYEEVLKK